MGQTLDGVCVLVTRARAQAGRLADLLRERGASVVEIPLLEVVALSTDDLDSAVRRIDTFTDVIVTSTNAADALMQSFERTGIEPPDRGALRIAAVGRSTSRSLAAWWREADLIPDSFVAESLLSALVSEPVGGRRFLFPRAAQARDVIVDGLRERGAVVEDFVVYESTLPAESAAALQALAPGAITLTTATSSSTVRHLAASTTFCPWLRQVPLASIGPITSAAAAELGFNVAIEARVSTVDGLVDAIETAFGTTVASS